ncbi:hypothetical protein [Oligoflexus tunisiensis]|uniref:hypothetical protein n=1 Tax=Oligoflexus tunisiensis TaxID=708132 RepID=UPI00114CCCEC|nr:hypothetical protein [Oligoflexus tunisiensis]
MAKQFWWQEATIRLLIHFDAWETGLFNGQRLLLPKRAKIYINQGRSTSLRSTLDGKRRRLGMLAAEIQAK